MAIIPKSIPAGVTLALRATLTAYPADEWTLALHLRGPEAIDIAGTVDGNAHLLEADAETTAEWTPGRYWYAVRATRGAEVVEVETGDVEVLRDLEQITGPHDGRGHVERVLDAIEAVLENRATIDQQSYKIGGRELVRTPITDLIKLRSLYRAELAREQAAARTGQSLLGRTVRVRFT